MSEQRGWEQMTIAYQNTRWVATRNERERGEVDHTQVGGSVDHECLVEDGADRVGGSRMPQREPENGAVSHVVKHYMDLRRAHALLRLNWSISASVDTPTWEP